MLDTDEAVLAAIGSRILPELNNRLHQYAAAAGWPHEVISAISVVAHHGELTVHVDPQFEAAVQELEYGSPPRSAIRKLKACIPSVVEPLMSNLLVQRVKEMVN